VYYPCCATLTGTAEKRYKKQLLDGFPNKDEEKKFNVGRPDLASGVIPAEYLVVGAQAMVKLTEDAKKWTEVEVLSKSRNGQNFIVEHDNTQYHVGRSAFKPESRRFRGFLKMFKKAPKGVTHNSDLIDMLLKFDLIATGAAGFTLDTFPKPKVELRYLTTADVKNLGAKQTNVAKTLLETALPIQWAVEGNAIFIIQDTRAKRYTLSQEYRSESGVGFFEETQGRIQLVGAEQDLKAASVKISKLAANAGNPMELMGTRRQKGQWLVLSGKTALVWQEKPELQIPVTLVGQHRASGSVTAAHRLVGYLEKVWADVGPVRYLKDKKLEVGKTYLARVQFADDGISKSKPLKVEKKQAIPPVFSQAYVTNLQKYAWEYPIFKRRVINKTLHWTVNEHIVGNDFKKKRFSE